MKDNFIHFYQYSTPKGVKNQNSFVANIYIFLLNIQLTVARVLTSDLLKSN